ncbi:hypothetical protein TWF696_006655 [Orbilia brochopaga]|uniref:F-box domain-containing protein n=1 Tax=Orbilia brochopaga TaxID=3140254 RepID=A0AAV9US06_9PEZI
MEFAGSSNRMLGAKRVSSKACTALFVGLFGHRELDARPGISIQIFYEAETCGISQMDTHSSPAECGGLPLLDRILFMPSPILDVIQAQLSIEDIVNLTRVCRTWRRYLIPDDATKQPLSGADLDARWHPLLRTVAVTHMSPKDQKFLYRREQSQNEIIIWCDEEYIACHFFPLRWLQGVFGQDYAAAITRIYLDGTIISIDPDSHPYSLAWISDCPNLMLLSLRWCTRLDLADVIQFFLNPQLLRKQTGYHEATDEVLTKLRTLLVWGTRGTVDPWRGINFRKADCSSLMEKYDTDIAWCVEPCHSDSCRPSSLSPESRYRSLINVKKRRPQCGICLQSEPSKCTRCELKNTCEECQGYVCNKCLIMENAEDHADLDIVTESSGPGFPTMLQYDCYDNNVCRRANNRKHYFHPSCAPRPFTPQGKYNPRLCNSRYQCKSLLCEVNPKDSGLCCGVGVLCFGIRSMACRGCGSRLSTWCGKCTAKDLNAQAGYDESFDNGAANGFY